MAKRYAIWDKKSPIITDTGKLYSPEEWIEEHPAARLDSVKVVCHAGEVNGGIFEILSKLVVTYSDAGCDFSKCETDEDYLITIEAFEDEMKAKMAEERLSSDSAITADALTSIAASLEYQNMMSLEDVEV